MISIDPPSDAHDLKVSDLNLKFSDDFNNQLPNFSIRDYVFGIRSKNIALNWPFSSTSLQLCLNHEVKNLLPPFQSLDSVRNNSPFLTRPRFNNPLISDKVWPENDQNDNLASNSSVPKEDQESQKPENVSSIRRINKKRRFIKHVAPNSETMTSKVCPVCKIFSSSSNTTLNAHIDRCLTGEGSLKWPEIPKVKVVVKPRIKPRKIRLMLDIYKTSKHCTIEELDRRNGSNWATNSSFRPQEFEFQVKEPKRTKINRANNEGDVYIDADGTKVRILSVPRARFSDNHGGQKLQKEAKRGKLGKKKKHVFKKKQHHKYLKLGSNARNLCLLNPRAATVQEENIAMKVADLGIIRPPWACSKRTVISKKCNSSGKNRKAECSETKDLISKSKKSSSKYDTKTPQNASDNEVSVQNTKKPRIEEFVTSNGDSSARIYNQDYFHPRDFVRNETLLSKVPSFSDLRTSFDPEFSKQDCDELYQNRICSTNRAPNDVEIPESYCHEPEPEPEPAPEPIPIPGPPGSFLPASPGGEMISEEQIQAVTVLLSSENHRIIDRDSVSNSPVSTVSNPRSTSVQDEIPFFDENSGLFQNSFNSDHQPCCCSRKEVDRNFNDSSSPIGLFSDKKFAVSSDCDSKPVIRLMGKNLTVVNKSDENGFHPLINWAHNDHKVVGFQTISGQLDLAENEADESIRNEFIKRYQGQMNPTHAMLSSYGGGGSSSHGGSTVFRGGDYGDFSKWNKG